MSGILNLLLGSAAGVIKDAYFNLVTLLLNTTATNGAQNNTFLDSSTNNFSITRNGNTTQGTFTPFSQTGWSNYFNGSSYLQTPSSTNYAFGTGDFTIEAFFFPTATTANLRLFEFSDNNDNIGANFTSTGTVGYFNGSTNTVSAGTPFAANQWNHVAAVRSSGTVTVYVNGTSALTQASTPNTTSARSVGIAGISNTYFPGYVSNVRILKGTAQYTATFTPPTAPLTAITNTQLLTCQSNRYVDNSTNAVTFTRGGTPSVQAFSPFVPTDPYSTSVVGGSAYFDGNLDSLSVSGTPNAAFQFGTASFTMECWLYSPTGLGSVAGDNIFDTRDTNTASTASAGVNFFNTGYLNVYIGSANLGSSTPIPAGSWVHVALVRNGSTATLYQNGVSVVSSSVSQISNDLSEGYYRTGSWSGNGSFSGYMTNHRVVKGTAVYTANFTPPTAPLTAISNTTLLLNHTNAGIYDATAKNDLETVGNAQVSTTQAKFGTTSIAFDGTGDNLKSKLTNAIGSGDYTIEGFFYASGSGIQYLFDMRETSQAIGAYIIGATTALNVNFGTTFDIAASLAFTLNSWNHLAFVRSGSGSNNTSVFLNGSRVYQRTDTTDYSIVPNIFIGCENSGNYYLNGYIDEFRITKGYARYSGSTYTVPAAAFPIQ